jgi:S1-C subfamily serine protease
MTQIEPGSPAANSGIKPGDILLQVGQRKVTQPEDVPDASFFVTAGDVVPITVVRGNQKMTFNVQSTLHPRQLLNQSPADLALPSHQAIPLKLESDAPPTP